MVVKIEALTEAPAATVPFASWVSPAQWLMVYAPASPFVARYAQWTAANIMNEACFYGWREKMEGHRPSAVAQWFFAPTYIPNLTGPQLHRFAVWSVLEENGCRWSESGLGGSSPWTLDSCRSNVPHAIHAPIPMAQRQRHSPNSAKIEWGALAFKLGGWAEFTNRSGERHWKEATAAVTAHDLRAIAFERYDIMYIRSHSGEACNWSVYDDHILAKKQRGKANPHVSHYVGREFVHSVDSAYGRKGTLCSTRGPVESRWDQPCSEQPSKSGWSGNPYHPPVVRVIAAARKGRGSSAGKPARLECGAAPLPCTTAFRVITDRPLNLSLAAFTAVRYPNASLLPYVNLTDERAGYYGAAGGGGAIAARFANATLAALRKSGRIEEFVIEVKGLRVGSWVTLGVDVAALFEETRPLTTWASSLSPVAMDMSTYSIDGEGGAMWPGSATVRIVPRGGGEAELSLLLL